jgi:tetratricopeptide (TPR) repeat protein
MTGLLLAALLAAGAGQGASQRQKGQALFREGRLEEAIAQFQEAVKLNPADGVAWYNLAYASRKAQKFEQAAEAYQKYTALSPEDPDGYFGLAESLRSLGRAAGAVDAYTKYIKAENRESEQKWVELAKARIKELSSAPAATATTTANATATTTATTTAAAAGVAKPLTPNETQTQLSVSAVARGDAALAANDTRAALFAYQDAIMAAPANVDARIKAGKAYEKMGYDDEAAVQWNKALQLDPGNAAARELLAAALDRRDGGTAAPSASTTPPAQPVDEAAARAHYTKAVGLINEHKFAEGAAELDLALAAQPGFALAMVARGSARMGEGRHLDALRDYAAAQRADPSLASPLYGMAEAYRGLGQNEKASQLYRQYAASTAPDVQPSLKEYALRNAQALSPQ